jgi:hypothetical protein
MKKKPVRRQQGPNEQPRRIPHIVIKSSFSESRRSYHLREKVGEDDLFHESFSCSDYPKRRLEHPLIVVRLLRIPGIKEIWLRKRSIEVCISKAFRWDELRPRIIRTLHQTFWSLQPQIVVLQQVPDNDSSTFRLEEVVPSRPLQLPNRIVLGEEKAGIRQTTYHLTLPLAKTVFFWKTDDPGLCKRPEHLKRLIEAILAVPGVTNIYGTPYEISVSHGAAFNKEEVQYSVIEILQQLFPDPASVVVEKAALPDSSLTTDSPKRRDALPDIQWRVGPASRMLVAPLEGSQWTRYFHLGSELANWNSLSDRHEDLPDWLQKPLEHLFGIPGVANIAIDKYSMAVEIAEGFRWSQVRPAVVAILEGICRLPVQVIYERMVSQASGKTIRRTPTFTSPGIFWHPDTSSNRERRYETSIWPPGTGNWRLWKSGDDYYQPRLDEFSPDLQHLISELLQAPGVTRVNLSPYEVIAEIGKAFNWTECQPGILQILNRLFPESEQQNILVRKKKWRRAGQLDKPPKYKIGTPRIFIARGYIEKISNFHLSIPTLFGKCWCSDNDSFRKLPRHLRGTMRKLAAGEGVKSVTVYPWQVQVYRTDTTNNAAIEKMALPLLKRLFPQPEDVIVRRLSNDSAI